MNSAALVPTRNLRCAAAGRLRLALAVSALLHLALLASLLLEKPWRGAARNAANAPITVTFAPAPIFLPDAPVAPHPERRHSSRPVRQPLEATDRAIAGRPSSGVARTGVNAPTLPHPPDPNYYTARDLDVYPRPVAPLDLDRLAVRATDGPSSGIRLTLTLLIDENGIVNDVAFASPVVPGQDSDNIRTLLAATRFTPALKDGRAVKSRVVLSVDLSREQREP